MRARPGSRPLCPSSAAGPRLLGAAATRACRPSRRGGRCPRAAPGACGRAPRAPRASRAGHGARGARRNRQGWRSRGCRIARTISGTSSGRSMAQSSMKRRSDGTRTRSGRRPAPGSAGAPSRGPAREVEEPVEHDLAEGRVLGVDSRPRSVFAAQRAVPQRRPRRGGRARPPRRGAASCRRPSRGRAPRGARARPSGGGAAVSDAASTAAVWSGWSSQRSLPIASPHACASRGSAVSSTSISPPMWPASVSFAEPHRVDAPAARGPPRRGPSSSAAARGARASERPRPRGRRARCGGGAARPSIPRRTPCSGDVLIAREGELGAARAARRALLVQRAQEVRRRPLLGDLPLAALSRAFVRSRRSTRDCVPQ